MLGARALISSSRISQPTEAHRIVPGASKDARWDHDGIGCALSSHSIMTRGQALKEPFDPTLAEALASGDLEAFIRQVEAEGIGPANREAFEALLGGVIKERPQEDQTSRSRGPGSKRGT